MFWSTQEIVTDWPNVGLAETAIDCGSRSGSGLIVIGWAKRSLAVVTSGWPPSASVTTRIYSLPGAVAGIATFWLIV